MSPIEKLTPAQEALVSVTCEKWKNFSLSTQPIDREKARTAIQAAYTISEQLVPDIIFCESPLVALQELRIQPLKDKHRQLYTYLLKQLHEHFSRRLSQQCSQGLQKYLYAQIKKQFYLSVPSELFYFMEKELIKSCSSITGTWTRQPSTLLSNSINPFAWTRSDIFPWYWIEFICWLDYCCSVLEVLQPQSRWKLRWQTLQDLFTTCGWIFAYEGICFVCERPTKLKFDNLGKLHSEGEEAIAFLDGLKFYAYHGESIPEEYGVIKPDQWHQKLLQKELNSRLFSILVPSIKFSLIGQLSSEQEDLIPFYRDKWRCLRLSEKTTSRQRAVEKISLAYELLNLPKPEILFFSNPDLAIDFLRNYPDHKECLTTLKSRLTTLKFDNICWILYEQVKAQIEPSLFRNLTQKLEFGLGFDLGRPFGITLEYYFPISPPFWRRLWGEGYYLALCQPDVWAARAALFDFCFTVLRCLHNYQAWQVLQCIAEECGYVFPYEERCIICDRPIKIVVDQNGHIHSEREPALVFADGFSVYVQHGKRLSQQDEGER